MHCNCRFMGYVRPQRRDTRRRGCFGFCRRESCHERMLVYRDSYVNGCRFLRCYDIPNCPNR